MSPFAKRVAILIIELMVFLTITAFATHFISHAGALQLSAEDDPPANFPVLAYDGDRQHPDAKNYRVLPWREWEGLAAKQPTASLLPPERAGKIRVGEGGKASFIATPEGDSRQSVELIWTGTNMEQHVRYLAQARKIEPRYFRSITSTTFLLGAVVGFIAGLLTGRVVRRRWLARPPSFTPPGKQG